MAVRALDAPLLDCFRILEDLRLAGLSNAAVARAIGVNPSTVHGWKEGDHEPSWSNAWRLIRLHAQTMGNPDPAQSHPQTYGKCNA